MDWYQYVASIAIAGVVGGMLNAAMSDNLFLWPIRVADTRGCKIIRPGLIANVSMSACAALGSLFAFGANGSGPNSSVGELLITLIGSILVGSLAARWVTNEADKRLLRAALAKACAAPAAHPDTARVMEIASPCYVFSLACQLVPKFRGTGREQ
jgi:hypothetical protein